MTRADDASKLAQLGFRIFPLRPNSKIPPAGLHWKEAASSDPEKALKLWSNGHADCNIGIRTGQGLVVLDFDNKPGQAGLQSLATLEAIYGLREAIAFRRRLEASTSTYARLLKQFIATVSADLEDCLMSTYVPKADTSSDPGACWMQDLIDQAVVRSLTPWPYCVYWIWDEPIAWSAPQDPNKWSSSTSPTP